MLLDLLFGSPRRAAANDIPWTDDLDSFGGRSWGGRRRPRAGPVGAEALALTSPPVWCATRVIAEPAAMFPLLPSQPPPANAHKEAPEHRLYSLLLTAP